MSGALQTEFPFTLPQGFADEDGTLQREGTMRLATAADEILPLKDPRVKANPSYLTVILLSRVVVSLGTLDEVTPHTVENLFVSDIAYLQALYERVNSRGADTLDTVCPGCGESFSVEVGDAAVTAHTHGGADAPADAPDDAPSVSTIADDADAHTDGGEGGNEHEGGVPWD
ncbi:hypothetical protein ACFQE1_09145 [Halobium palmae]|uniref:Phage tail assembly protein n=1 Tax=Halobium palmae TaxID=1776492 RepID=A0ABD5S0T2_9EURY